MFFKFQFVVVSTFFEGFLVRRYCFVEDIFVRGNVIQSFVDVQWYVIQYLWRVVALIVYVE